MRLINTDILKNPLNWITVLLMLVIFAMFADIMLRHYGDLQDAADPIYQGK
jgi:hypothetical protein